MATTYNAGSASIKITPDLSGFHRRIKQTLRAERIEAPVVVTPDMSQFAQKLEAGLGRISATIGVEVQPDLSGFGQRLEAGLSRIRASMDVEVNPDMSGFSSRLNAALAASGGNVSIPVDLDFTRARQQLAAFRVEAAAAVRANFDLDITAALARIAALQAAAAGVGSSAGGMGSIGSSAAGMVNPIQLATVALAALAAVNLVPLIGQFAQAAGVISLLPAVAASAAAAISALVIGSTGVIDAFKAGSKAAEDAEKDAAAASKAATQEAKARAAAARGVESAQRGVESAAKGVERAERGVIKAERGVEDAQKSAMRAQQSLTDARKDATEQIEDLNLALKGSSLDERDAELSLRRAQQRLAELGKDGQPVTALDFEEAYLGVDQAKQRIDEVRERNADLREETDAANKAGVDGSKQVVSAQEAVADADVRVADSKQSLVDAQDSVVESQQSLMDSQTRLAEAQAVVVETQAAAATSADKYSAALANLSPNARQFVEDTRGLGDAWKDLRLAVQDNLFAGMGTSITDLANNYFPLLKDGLGGIATELNGGLRRAIEDLNTESVKLDWSNILDNTRLAIGPFMDGLSSLTGALTNIASIGSDFLPGGAESFKETMQGFEDWTESEDGQKRIRSFMENSIEALKEIKDLFLAIGGVIGGLFSTSEENGKSMIQSMTDSLNEFADWMKSEEGKVRMKQFWDDAQQTAKDLLALTGEAIKLADKVAGLVGNNFGLTKPAGGGDTLDPQNSDGATGYGSGASASTDSSLLGGTETRDADGNLIMNDGSGRTKKYVGEVGGVQLFPGVAEGGVADKTLGFFGGLDDFFAGESWSFLDAKEGESPFQASIRKAGDSLSGLKTKATELANGFVADIKGTASDAWNGLSSTVQDKWNNNISPAIEAFKTGGLGGLADYFTDKITNGAIPTFGQLPGAIGGAIGNIVDEKFPWLKTGLDGVQGWFGDVVDAIGRKWNELKELAATPINWIIDTVINGTLKNAWNAVAGVIPGLKTWDGVARIETQTAARGGDSKEPIQKFATGGIMPGYTPGRDPYTIGVSGGEAVMRPEWQRAMGPQYINEANRVARTQGVAGVRKLQRDANFALGGVVDESLWNAASAAFPNATLNSAHRPGHSGYHGQAQAIDLGGPMQQIADWIYNTYPDSAQLIWGPGPLLYNVGGNKITDQNQLANSVYAGDLPGHFDHVHWASDVPISSDGAMVSEEGGGGFVSGVRNVLGGAVESARGLAAKTFEKAAGAIGSNIPDFGPSLIGQLPRNVFDGIKGAMSEAIRGKANSGGGSGPDAAFEPGAGAEQWRQMMVDAYKNQGYEPTPEKIDAWVRQIHSESSGDPNIAQQITDINGTGESAGVGLGQMIPTTWQAYRDPSLADNRRDPWAMTNAMVRYGEQKYGDRLLDMIGHGHGYDSGGIFENNTIGWNTSGKPEAVLTNDQWKLFDGFNKNLGNFATGGVVDPNEYLRNRLSKYGSDVAGIAKSAIPEILGISGTPLDLTNNRYIDAAMEIGTAVQGGVSAATAANYGTSAAPTSTAGPTPPNMAVQPITIVVQSLDEALRRVQLEQQRQKLSFR